VRNRDATRKALSKPAAFVMLIEGLTLKTELTAARLRELLHYNPETGVFTRLITLSSRSKAGDIPGSPSTGYIAFRVEGVRALGHRWAWFWMTGAWPEDQIDHIDGNRSNNKWPNLRAANNGQNQQNRKLHSRNTSGFPGVSWFAPAKMWRASIMADRKVKNLGYFKTAEAAGHAYAAAKANLHTFCPAVRAS